MRPTYVRAVVYRFVSVLVILAIGLPPMPVVAQAIETPTPEATATALPTDLAPTDVATDVIPSETPTEGPTATETATATAVAETPTETPTLIPTDTPAPTPTATPFSELPIGIEITSAGGEIKSADGNVSIVFPANAVTEAVTVNYQALAKPPLDAKGNQKAIFAFEVTAKVAAGLDQGLSVTKFAEKLDFTVDLSPLDLRPGEVDGRTIRFDYFNEETQLWEPVPFALDSADGALKIKAQVDHFSVFGVSRDFNPGWSLLYNEPSVDTFTGAATYNYPIVVPPGPNGLQPNLSLAYNNQQLAGLQAWYQSDWVGHGWSLNTIEIVRDLGPNTANGHMTANNNGSMADCTDRFTLLFNGTGYKLIAATAGATSGVYYTQQQSNLYIKRINDTAAPNQIKQYWLVKDENGTEYRLGYNADSEQITHSNCTDANESRLLSSQIGGTITFATFRWRLDQVKDIYNNVMTLDYLEDPYRQCGPGNGYDDYNGSRGSQLYHIYYGNTAIYFDLGSRYSPVLEADYVIADECDRLFYQRWRLDAIRLQTLSGTPLHKYTFGYQIFMDSERNGQNPLSLPLTGPGTRVISSITETGYDSNGQNPAALPATTTFTYAQRANSCRADIAGCEVNGRFCEIGEPQNCFWFYYWHLEYAHNGYGATTRFNYEDDGRKVMYTYRVNIKDVYAGNGPTLKWVYIYTTPCYNEKTPSYLGTGGTYCMLPAPPGVLPADGPLMGHQTVKVDAQIYVNNAWQLINHTKYQFEIGVYNPLANDGGRNSPGNFRLGRELHRWVYRSTTESASNLISETLSNYNTSLTFLYNITVFDPYVQANVTHPIYRARTTLTDVTEITRETETGVTMKTLYTYDPTYANLTRIEKQGDVSKTGDEQVINRTYLNDTSTVATTGRWFVGKVISETVKASTLVSAPTLAETRYFYDGQTPTSGTCAVDNAGCALTASAQTLGTQGALTAHANWISGALWAVSETTYGSYGNVLTTKDPRRHVTTFGYDSLSPFPYLPVSTGNELGHTTTMTYNNRGLVASLTDPNLQTINYEYDKFGRLVKVYEPNNPATFPALEYQYTDAYVGGGLTGLRVVTKVREASGGSSTLDTYTFYNGMGQVIQVRSPMAGGQQSVVNTVYGAGNTVQDSYTPGAEPFSADFSRPAGWNATARQTHATYDALLRPISVTLPGIAQATTTSYGPLTVTVIDANSHKKVQTLDGLGRLTKVEEFSGVNPYTLYATTTYSYNALGNLLTVQPPAGPATVMTYDNLSRKLTMNDPAMGNWSYQYDSAGNLTRQTDAKTQAICLAYDALSRLTGKTYGCGATPTITYTYDDVTGGNKGKGRRTGMTDPSGSTSWVYDYLGRMTSETHTINNVGGANRTYTLGHAYDLLGRATGTTYPNSEVVNQTYNAQGLPQLLTSTTNGNYVTGALYNALGQMTQLSPANGVASNYSYDPANRLSGIAHQTATSTLAGFTYTFDNVGNPTQVVETASQATSGGGTTYTVTKTTDTNDGACDADCSLREAVRAANAATGTDTIIIPAGTYTLTLVGADTSANAGDLDITDSVALIGSGAATTSVSANAGLGDRLFQVINAVTVTMSGLTMQNGNVASNGGGLHIPSGANVTLVDSVVSNNTASGAGNSGGGIYNSGGGTLNLMNVTVSGNASSTSGGGVYNNGTLVVNNSTFNGNTANNQGGGILNSSTMTLTNSTVSGNTASTSNGGGVRNSSTATGSIVNTTIVNNTSASAGGGIQNSNTTAGALPVKNVLLSGNVMGATNSNCNGTLTSQGNNLSSDTSCSASLTGTGDLNNTAAQLGPLQNNGGPTNTHALLAGSPAINAGTNSGCPLTDQRGTARPQGFNCDIGAFELASAATGTTYTVTKTADTNDGTCDADCSLREAVRAANTAAGTGTIVVPAGTYTLTITGSDTNANAGDLDLTDSVAIIGSGAATTIVSAGAGLGDRLFQVNGAFTVTMSGLTIQNGSIAATGGGLRSEGGANVTLVDSVVSNNTASGAGNSGGGIYNAGSTSLSLLNVTVSGNVSSTSGGGVYNNGTLVVNNSTISGNTANSQAGGLLNGGVMTVINSTVSGNTASTSNGGGVRNSSTATGSIVNTTIANNTSATSGGGIQNSNATAGALTVKNVLLSGNLMGATNSNCNGTLTSQGNNLSSDTSCSASLTGTGDLNNTAAQLGPLQNNGGPTSTHALSAGSPAINAGTNSGCPLTDQRGTARPQGFKCDIGAFEYGALASSNTVIAYAFDHLDRLTHADYTGGSLIDYTYDVMGNRLAQNSNIGSIGNTAYGYATNNRLTSINGSTTGLAYDANGNMTSRRENSVTWTQNFDFENRLTSASNSTQTWQFAYDGDGNRVKQVAANGDVTAYVGGLYEVTYSSSGTLKNTKLYYAFGGQVVALRDNGTLYYLHSDNLGSASLTTSASGSVVSQSRYYPFGASRFTQGTRPTDLDFTGQRLDGTGLHFYNARYYASGLGRFVQADVVTPGAGSQAYNRYAYALSNPLRYTDPSGFCSETDGKWDSVLDCTIEDFEAMPWDQRGRWVLEFSAQTGVDKFKNIIGIIAYFRDDPVFTNSAWAKLSDAGVLFVIMDGYNRSEGAMSSCSVGGQMCTDTSALWRDFFLAERNGQADAYEKWGDAEQAGVNYGIAIAKSLRDQAGWREQIQIDTFVGFGNAYRSLIKSGAGRPLNTLTGVGGGGWFDPGTPHSGGFVYAWSQIVISPVSLVIYIDVVNRDNTRWPGTPGIQ